MHVMLPNVAYLVLHFITLQCFLVFLNGYYYRFTYSKYQSMPFVVMIAW